MTIKSPEDALKPLAAIAHAFESNLLDKDGARLFWGQPDNHRKRPTHDRVSLCTGVGGRILLTLANAFEARSAITFELRLVEALKPLAEICRTYDENGLNGDARKIRGGAPTNIAPADVVLVADCDGNALLTLQDAMDGRDTFELARENARTRASQLEHVRAAARALARTHA